MKDGTIVPNVYGGNGPFTRDVGFDPMDIARAFSQPCLCPAKRSAGYVENSYTVRTAVQQSVREAGIPAPDVDDSGLWRHADPVKQVYGRFRVLLKPTNIRRCVRLEYPLPVFFSVHESPLSCGSGSPTFAG